MVGNGKIIFVNLNTGDVAQSEFPVEAERKMLFGRAFNSWYLSRTDIEKVAPFDPESHLLLSCGMLAGMGAPAASRLHITARSPLTNLLGSSNVGGETAERLAWQGIRAVVIQGRAAVPSVLWIQGGDARVVQASGLWGGDTEETTKALQDEAGTKHASVLAIGPGGENGVRFACIMAGGHHAAGRTGLGAVMGAKRLKAIVVEGKLGGSPGPAAGRAAAAQYAKEITTSSEFRFLSAHGGAGYLKWAHNAGIMSSFNFRSTRFGGIGRIDGRRLTSAVKNREGCPRCPVKCKADLEMPGQPRLSVRPEFEPLMALGPRCGLSDLEKIVFLDNLCSRLGIDNISTGGVLAFAMDLHERGLLPRDSDVAPVWGDADAMEKIIRRIVRREGIGGLLAEGVRRAATKLGGDAPRYAAHVKGLELSGYHPAALPGTALAYAVAGRGGDFNDLYPALEYSLPSEEDGGAADGAVDDTVALVRTAMLVSYSLDCLGLCKVPVLSLGRSWTLNREASLASALIGRVVSAEELMAVGERTATLERMLNLRCGLDVSDEALPEIFATPGYDGGDEEGFASPPTVDFYRRMGWDDHGRPTVERLEQLELGDINEPSGLRAGQDLGLSSSFGMGSRMGKWG
jgi:aldehyde:ferredoxin oxidoreductase